MTGRALALAICFASSMAYAQDPPPDTINYRAKEGDTLGLIAAEHYGDRRKAIFIVAENRIKQPRPPLRPGERLRIPINREITTSPGDTFQTLAERLLGDAQRAIVLAEHNGRAVDDHLPAGTELQVPLTVTHRAIKSEALTTVAASYLNDAKQADMLRQYNQLEKTALEKGESLIIPAFGVRLQPAKVPAIDARSKTRRAARRATIDKAMSALPAARAAWRTGEVRRIESLLTGIDPDYLETPEAVDVTLLRGLAHAAIGKSELAVEQFKQLRARKASYVLRRFDYSPKIIALWERAGGTSE